MTFRPGQLVRFNTDSLGCLDSPNGASFNKHIVNSGDTGTVWGVHPELSQWYIVEVQLDNPTRTVFVPVHPMALNPIEG